MNEALIASLLTAVIAAVLSQTVVVWRKIGGLEKKMVETKCPFGKCPLYSRAVEEAVPRRIVTEGTDGER